MHLTINIKQFTKGIKRMKEQTLQKIHKLGKVGSVLTLIAQILLYVALVCVLIGTILLAVLPKDFMTMQIEGTGEVHLNIPELFEKLKLTDLDKFEAEAYNTKFTLDNLALDITGVTRTETGIVMNTSGQLVNFSSNSLLNCMVVALIYIAMAIVTLYFIRKLCKAFRECSSPFSPEIIRNLTHVAYAMIPWTVFSSLSEGCMSSIFSGNFSLNVGVNLNMIFVILIIFVLVQIFKYGAALQQESDETL